MNTNDDGLTIKNIKDLDDQALADLFAQDLIIINEHDATVKAEMVRRGIFEIFESAAARMLEMWADKSGPKIITLKKWHKDRLNYYSQHFGNPDPDENGYLLTSIPVARAKQAPQLVDITDTEFKFGYIGSRIWFIDDPQLSEPGD